ncbi:hypothetical protein T08_4641 [Trichinella sp. T8]|nr:hypothetical protein T08_4641 [Trichinella sp. T8]
MRLKRPRWPLRRRGKLCTVFGHFGIPELITAALIDASPFNASLSNCPLAVDSIQPVRTPQPTSIRLTSPITR